MRKDVVKVLFEYVLLVVYGVIYLNVTCSATWFLIAFNLQNYFAQGKWFFILFVTMVLSAF